MNKNELISAVSEETGFTKIVVKRVIDATLANITWILSKEGKVKIDGFGAFQMQKRAARTGRNPHTREAVPIPARIKATFTPGAELKRLEREIDDNKKRKGGK